MLDLEAHRLADSMHMCVVCGVAYSHARTLGVARDRLHLIPNGVPLADAKAPLDLRALLGIAPDAPIVGFVGRLSPEKAPDAFVRMAWLVAHEHPSATFVIIGNGVMQSELGQMVRSFDIADRVHFLGERHDVRLLLPSLTLLALTSRAEGMPLALMERWPRGCPWLPRPLAACLSSSSTIARDCWWGQATSRKWPNTLSRCWTMQIVSGPSASTLALAPKSSGHSTRRQRRSRVFIESSRVSSRDRASARARVRAYGSRTERIRRSCADSRGHSLRPLIGRERRGVDTMHGVHL